MEIAYLGMGNMGVRMAPNLFKSGHHVKVWARPEGNSWKNVEKLIGQGLQGCRTIQEAVNNAEIIGICVTNDEAVTEICSQVVKYCKPGAIIADHSTISPHTAIRMADMFHNTGCEFLDAPISGGESGAEAGTLTLMIGGDRDAFDKCRPYFDAVSSYAVYMGKSGNGSITKLLNNQISGINHAVVCEAVNEANRADIDLEALYTVINHSWGRSFAFERIVIERLKDNTFYPTYAPCEMINKDMHHAIELANELGVNAEFARIASKYFQRSCEEGHSKWDQASVILCMEADSKKQPFSG